MLTLEMAIQKFQELPPDQQNKVISFIESLEMKSNQSFSAKTDQETKIISFAEAAHEFIGCLDSDIESRSLSNDFVQEDEDFEAIADGLADEFQRYVGTSTPQLSDYAVSRAGIYQEHP
ncbi:MULTISPECIES: hypothetical protein [Planktothricoides]|uniref:hypothetical protein n=1 Tax=Planktothricoides TaxID=132607 RepID=UPI00092E9E39|nr:MULTISPECIES: hypothetical protein [Planktothricoides]